MTKLEYLKNELNMIRISNDFIKAEIIGNSDDIIEIAMAISRVIRKIEKRKSSVIPK